MLRSALPLVGAVALAYSLLCAWMFLTQRGQIYFRTPASEAQGAEVLWLESQGERIKVWVVSRPAGRALLYFGGNAEDVAGNLESFASAFPDRSLYLVNYRGYGGSTGRPTEAGLVADAISVFDHVRREHADIAVMGRSLGSGVAVQLASVRPVERLVLVTAYDSLVNVARGHFWWLPVGLLMLDRYESVRLAPALTTRALVVIAAEDEVIPRPRTDALVAAFAPGLAEVVVVADVGHNTLDWSPRYLDALRGFLAATVAGPGVRGAWVPTLSPPDLAEGRHVRSAGTAARSPAAD